jgi:hypothetical protein
MRSSLRRLRRLAVLGIAGEAPLTMSCGRPGPCSGPGQGPPLAQPWSQPDGEPGCGGGGRTAPVTAGLRRPPLRRWKLDKRCAHRADGVPSITVSRFRTSEMPGAGERIRTADRPLTRRIRTVSGRRRSWPDLAFSWDNRLPGSPYVVGRLPVLAPLLAPCTSSTAPSGYKNVAVWPAPWACTSATWRPSRPGPPWRSRGDYRWPH